jgi:hypothetical protein
LGVWERQGGNERVEKYKGSTMELVVAFIGHCDVRLFISPMAVARIQRGCWRGSGWGSWCFWIGWMCWFNLYALLAWSTIVLIIDESMVD